MCKNKQTEKPDKSDSKW